MTTPPAHDPPPHDPPPPDREQPTIKHHTVAVQESIASGDRAPLRHFDSRSYTQHNLALGDGFGPLLEFLDSLPRDTTRVRAVRAFEDGDTSFAHLEYELGPLGPMVGFEVHRWHDGHIVEHWDNLEPIGVYPADDVRPWATSGPTEVSDPAATEATRALAARVVDEVLITADAAAGERLIATDLVDHAHRGVGRSGLVTRLVDGETRYVRRHRVLAEGDFALVLSEGLVDDQPSALYDLFRAADGVVVERWNVTQLIPPRDEWANDNGKF